MKRLNIFTSFAVLVLGASCLASCNNGPLKLEISDYFDTAYIGEVYDFGDYINQENGVNYSIECYYQNYYDGTEHQLAVDGLTFVPTEPYAVSVITTAKKGGSQIKKTVQVPVELRGDPIDELIKTGGYSGWSDPGWNKSLQNAEMYLHNNDTNNQKSATSVICAYNGTNEWTWGATLLCIHNFRCLDHWTDKTWENAIISMWVYNPTDYNIEFQLRVVDNLTGKINIDWGHELNKGIVQYAYPSTDTEHTENGWSRIIFPLKKIGLNHTLYENEDGTRNDSLVIKSQYKGPAVEGVYNYQFYVDGLDVVNHDYNDFYKEIDTRYPDRVENRIVANWVDEGIIKTANYKDKEGDNPDMVLEGDSSLRYTFDYDKAEHPEYNYGAACMCMNDSDTWDEFTAQSDADLENAVFKCKVYNTSDENLEFALRIVDAYSGVNYDWSSDASMYKHFIAEPNKWTDIVFSLRKVGIRNRIIKQSSELDNQFILKVQYQGDRTKKYNFSFYVDCIDVVKYEKDKFPDLDTNGLTPTQNAVFGAWMEDGFTREAYFGTDTTKVKVSDSSIHYTYNYSPTTQEYGLQAIGMKDKSFHYTTTDKYWTNSTLKMWIYNNSNAQLEFGIRAAQGSIDIDWPTSEDICPHVKANAKEWTEVTFDLKKMGITEPIYGNEGTHEFTLKVKYLGTVTGAINFDFYVDGIDVVSNPS